LSFRIYQNHEKLNKKIKEIQIYFVLNEK